LFQARTAAGCPGQPPQKHHAGKSNSRSALCPTDIDRLIELYKTGIAINDLASEFGINRTTVMHHAERAGASRRQGIAERHLEEARRLYERGRSLAKVGRHLV